MSTDTNQFWNLLTESRLVPPAQIQSLFAAFSKQKAGPQTPDMLARWMVNQGALSPYQAEILKSGHQGPFHYGDYGVVDRMAEGQRSSDHSSRFTARHRKTGFGVVLQFVSGSDADDLGRWKRIERRCNGLRRIDSAFVNPVFETVVLASHRFLVLGVPSGKSIDRLPHKSRLPWQQACAVAAQAALGLQAVHDQDQLHGSLRESSIWMQTGGDTRIMLDPVASETPFHELGADQQAERLACLAPEVPLPASTGGMLQLTPQAEIYTLGCVLIRLLTARAYCTETTPDRSKDFHQTGKLPSLDKYEMSDSLKSLVLRMLAKDPKLRPDAAEAANLLSLYSGRVEQFEAMTQQQQADVQRNAYLESIRQFVDEQGQEVAPRIELGVDHDENERQGPEAAQDKIKAAREKAAQRKKQKWVAPVIIAASLIAFLGAISIWAYLSSFPAPIAEGDGAGTLDEGAGNSIAVPSNDPTPGRPAGIESEALPNRSGFVPQTLMEDDDQTLWETPTTGPPIAFGYLPAAPKLLLTARPAELMATEEGPRLLKSLGPDFEQTLTGFSQQAGVELRDIQQLVISFHDNQQQEYDVHCLVTLDQPIALDRLKDLWRQPEEKKSERGAIYYETPAGTSYHILKQSMGSATPTRQAVQPEATGVTRFSFGKTGLVIEAAEVAGGIPLSGAMKSVAAWSDSDRHLTFLFLRPALFNDRGQSWMGSQLADFNRELSVMIPDGVEGGLVGYHFDQGNYLEVRFETIADLKPGALRQLMENELRLRREQLTDFVAQIQPNVYWNRVRVRYVSMITDAMRNVRWSVEHGEVVGNVWLPPMAAHNLLAASELVSSFARGSAAQPVAANGKPTPQTLDALLAAKRDLEISNPPDLNVLMADLKTEIETDYGELPFQWDIKLLGGDLEAEGITKNQRPGALTMKQKSLSEILTSIMVSANPSKDISGAADPNCKLIWVVAADPAQPEQQAILITTRAAAAEKSYQLPPPFRLPEN